MVYADEARSVGEDGLDLQQRDHVGDTLHDLILGQHAGGVVHHFFYGLAFACALERARGDVGH